MVGIEASASHANPSNIPVQRVSDVPNTSLAVPEFRSPDDVLSAQSRVERFARAWQPTPATLREVRGRAVTVAKAAGAGLGLGVVCMGTGMVLGGLNAVTTLVIHNRLPPYASMTRREFNAVAAASWSRGAHAGAYPGLSGGIAMGVLLVAGSNSAEDWCVTAVAAAAAGSAAYDVGAVVLGHLGGILVGVVGFGLNLSSFGAGMTHGLHLLGHAGAWIAAMSAAGGAAYGLSQDFANGRANAERNKACAASQV